MPLASKNSYVKEIRAMKTNLKAIVNSLTALTGLDDLFCEYRKDPFDEEKKFAFEEKLRALARALAPKYPLHEDPKDDLYDIYEFLWEYAMTYDDTDFLTSATHEVQRHFGR